MVKISICICQNVGVCVMFSYTDYSSSIVPQTVALMNEEINRRIEKFTKLGLSLQPSIFVVEDLVETSNYVCFNRIVWKFPTLIKCIDACFKTHMVLNLKYSPEVERVWIFFQSYFYGIRTAFDATYPNVSQLIHELTE